MKRSDAVLNLDDDDDTRWEEYKFECLRHPSMDKEIDQKPYTERFNNYITRPRRTLMKKEGQSNISFKGRRKQSRRFFKDCFISLLELRWRYVIFLFFAAFLMCYGAFAVAYYVLAWSHGDLDNLGNVNYAPCIENLEGAWDAFLFSIETQSTIGYGIIYAHPECGSTLPIIYLQVTVGFLFETLMFGFIFAKMSNLLFILIENCRADRHELEFNAHEMGDKLFLFWPLVLTHRITESSPLYTLKPDDLSLDRFEVIVYLEGCIESTGELCQARTSYTSSEILWGHRFTRIEEYDAKNDLWIMDFVRFNQVVPSVTPKMSAAELAKHVDEENKSEHSKTSSWRLSTRTSNAALDNEDVYNTASEEDENAVAVVVTKRILDAYKIKQRCVRIVCVILVLWMKYGVLERMSFIRAD